MQCSDNRHLLYWGVRPLLLGSSGNTNDLIAQGLKYRQNTIQVSDHTTQTWLDTSVRPPALSISVSKQRTIAQQQECLLEAARDGDIDVRLESMLQIPLLTRCAANNFSGRPVLRLLPRSSSSEAALL